MANDARLGLILMGILAGCHPPTATHHQEVGSPRLVAANGTLYIRHAPPGNRRGTIFVVSSHETIAGGVDRARVGLVQGIQTHGAHGGTLEVVEVCPIPKRERYALETTGLLAEPLREDTRARVGNCLAQYELPVGTWDRSAAFVDLTLDVGLGDGLKEHDRYQIHGDEVIDSLNRTVTGFQQLGSCAVLGPLTLGHATCRLDKHQWPEFTQARAMGGGYAQLEPAADRP